jgi:outer membrane autotransporter protein
MTVGLLSYAVESFMRGWTGTASAEAGTILEIDGYRFEPTVALNYQYASTDEYREKGGGGLSLLIDPDDTQSLRSALTARLSRVFDLGDRKIVPQLRVDWRHEFLDRGQSFQAAFAGAPTVLFNVEGTEYVRDTFGLGASVTVPISGRTTGYVDAQGAMSADTVSGMLTVGVRATW